MTGRHRGGSGEPLLLIHGFSCTWRVWEPMLPALEQHHDVLALTLAGHVEGPQFAEGVPISMAAIVDQVENDLDEAGWEKAHIVGNSLGGWVTLELAKRGRALSAVPISPAGGWETASKEEDRLGRLFRRSHRGLRLIGPYVDKLVRRPRLRALMLRDFAARPVNIPPRAAAGLVRGMAEMEQYVPLLEALQAGGPPKDFDGIDCPVRILWGTKDTVLTYPRYAKRFEQLVPDAELVELPGLGHSPMWDDPQLLVDRILEVTTRARAPEPAAA